MTCVTIWSLSNELIGYCRINSNTLDPVNSQSLIFGRSWGIGEGGGTREQVTLQFDNLHRGWTGHDELIGFVGHFFADGMGHGGGSRQIGRSGQLMNDEFDGGHFGIVDLVGGMQYP